MRGLKATCLGWCLMTTQLYPYQIKEHSHVLRTARTAGIETLYLTTWPLKLSLQITSFTCILKPFEQKNWLQFLVAQKMDSSTENLLHGGMNKFKSCDQDSLTEAQQHLLGNHFKNKYSSLRRISCISLCLNLILITSLLLLGGEASKSSRSEYGRLVSEHFSSMC